jgi:hypothetical protein
MILGEKMFQGQMRINEDFFWRRFIEDNEREKPGLIA